MTTAAFAVRPANADDMDAVAAIYGEDVMMATASFEIEPPSTDEMRARFGAITGAGYPYFVAVTDGEVAGYAYASEYRSRPGYRYTVENSVYVKSACRGYGAGRALLAQLIDWCSAQGFRQMIAVIGGADNAASIGLHAALGFCEVGRLPAVGRKFDRWIDSVLMQRALGDGAQTPPSEGVR
ncbi:MAG: N-acetyltransferase [Betaproteobacteria bacterium]|nr:N-acetyltransferase [Betaproteobacteria bacterium]